MEIVLLGIIVDFQMEHLEHSLTTNLVIMQPMRHGKSKLSDTTILQDFGEFYHERGDLKWLDINIAEAERKETIM